MDGAEEKQSDGKREYDHFSFWLTEMEDARTLKHKKCGYNSNGENAAVRFCSGFDNLESKVVGLWSFFEYPRLHAPHLGRVEAVFRMRERGIFHSCATMRLDTCGPLRCVDSGKIVITMRNCRGEFRGQLEGVE